MRSRDASFGVPSGIHPSPRRAQRSSAAGAEPPNQIGTGADGRGLMPACSMVWNSPSKENVVLAPQPPHQLDLLGLRRPRFVNVSFSPRYSTAFHPVPTPSRSRFPDSTATSAACLATSTVWRWGRIRTS